MNFGDAFLRTDSDRHLWVVLSDPSKDPNNILLVNLTSWKPEKERACVLNVGDHPWITHETCVNYNDFDAIVTTLPKLHAAKDAGALKMQEPLSEKVLQLILQGAAESVRLSLEKAEILASQGLIVI